MQRKKSKAKKSRQMEMHSENTKECVMLATYMTQRTIRALYKETEGNCYLNDDQVRLLKDCVHILALLHQMK